MFEITRRERHLRHIARLQCTAGVWDKNPYNHGVADGIILALAILDDVEPQFIPRPSVYINDLKHGLDLSALAPDEVTGDSDCPDT